MGDCSFIYTFKTTQFTANTEPLGIGFAEIIEGPQQIIEDKKGKGSMIKVLSWYDNEYGYSCRLIDLIKRLR